MLKSFHNFVCRAAIAPDRRACFIFILFAANTDVRFTYEKRNQRAR
jgi:hypothetical protein